MYIKKEQLGVAKQGITGNLHITRTIQLQLLHVGEKKRKIQCGLIEFFVN